MSPGIERRVPGAGPGARPVAAGGWRRAVLGLAVGCGAGALLGFVLPPEVGRR